MAVAVVTMIALGFAAEVAKRQERTNGVVRASLVPYAFILREILMKRMLTDGGYVADAALANFFIWGGAYPVGFFPPETQKYVVLARRLCEQGGVFCDVERVLRTLR
jgi:hypothetical protein